MTEDQALYAMASAMIATIALIGIGLGCLILALT